MNEMVCSHFFHNYPDEIDNPSESIPEMLLALIDDLNNNLKYLDLPSKIECIYNSTLYARHTFEMYIRMYCNTRKNIMYFGMNPGPWGMSQTGVPFGEVKSVKEWLKIEGPVDKPLNEIKARPVKGFECQRTEISGQRFWGLFKEVCISPDVFFKSSFVYNYLPQQWMKSNGCNITPGDFKVSEMQPLYDICDPIFAEVIKLYDVKIIIAIGKFCETRAKKVLKMYLPSSQIEVLYLPHPSPRTVNNTNWHEKAMEFLIKHKLLNYYQT